MTVRSINHNVGALRELSYQSTERASQPGFKSLVLQQKVTVLISDWLLVIISIRVEPSAANIMLPDAQSWCDLSHNINLSHNTNTCSLAS